ncbi:MAG: LysR family transcriptional regulator [Clostridia bacterium]|nr:LysR family transcriptional regulator [Clostridia bacterium]MDH7574063.1 LysR family transcriptional regulator [Clostridia bacterium]
MTFHQLLILLTIVEEGSFSEAARKLGISQAAVSAQIKTLERELGQVLLVRRAGAGRPKLTSAGHLAYRAAAMVLRTLQNLTTQLEGLRTPKPLREASGERIEVASDSVAGPELSPVSAGSPGSAAYLKSRRVPNSAQATVEAGAGPLDGLNRQAFLPCAWRPTFRVAPWANSGRG